MGSNAQHGSAVQICQVLGGVSSALYLTVVITYLYMSHGYSVYLGGVLFGLVFVHCSVLLLAVAQVGPKFPALRSGDGPLDYNEVKSRLDEGMGWLAHLYCNTMNTIHYM